MPLNQDFRRVLTLDRTHHSVKVGRASKNLDRGLIPAFDNAWIDNPVISREHARIHMGNPEETVSFTALLGDN